MTSSTPGRWTKRARSSLEAFDRGLKRAIGFVEKAPRSTLVLFSLLFVVGLVASGRLKQTVSIEDQLDPSLDSTRELQNLKDLFGHDETLGALVMPRPGPGFTAGELCGVVLAANNVAHDHIEIADFSTALQLRQAQFGNDHLSYPRLLPSPCEGSPDQRFDLQRLQRTPTQGILISEKGTDFLVNFSVRQQSPDSPTGTFRAEAVAHIIQEFEQKASLTTHWIGTAALQLATLQAMWVAQLMNFSVLLVLLIGLRLFLGTWRAGLIYGATLIITNALVYGGMALAGHKTDPLAICLFLILSVACLEDFIFLSIDKFRHHGNERDSFQVLVTPSFFTSLSSILGFGSLLISPIESIRHFGGWSAFGCGVEWLLLFFLLPAFLAKAPAAGRWTNPNKSLFTRFSLKALNWTPPRKWALLSLLVFVYPLVTWQTFRLSQTPTDLFPKSHPFQQAMDLVKETRGWTAEASLVFNPEFKAEEKNRVLAEVQKDPLVARMQTFSQTAHFVQASVTDPLVQDLISRELKSSSVGEHLIAKTGHERAILYLRTTETVAINNFRTKIQSLCPDHQCWLSGEFIAFADYSKQLIGTLFESLFVSLVLVSLVLVYLAMARGASSPRALAALLLSSFWGPASLLCLIQLLGADINMITCIVAGALVGLTGDNAIQYLFASEGEEDLHRGVLEKGLGTIQCAVLMAASSLLFLLSPFQPPRVLGLLLGAGFLCSLIGDLWIFKGLLKEKN